MSPPYPSTGPARSHVRSCAGLGGPSDPYKTIEKS